MAARTSASSRRRWRKLFPRGQTIHLNFWDYNDVARKLARCRNRCAREEGRDHYARRAPTGADRTKFADSDLLAAAKGFYVIRDFKPGVPRHGYVVTQGSAPPSTW